MSTDGEQLKLTWKIKGKRGGQLLRPCYSFIIITHGQNAHPCDTRVEDRTRGTERDRERGTDSHLSYMLRFRVEILLTYSQFFLSSCQIIDPIGVSTRRRFSRAVKLERFVGVKRVRDSCIVVERITLCSSNQGQMAYSASVPDIYLGSDLGRRNVRRQYDYLRKDLFQIRRQPFRQHWLRATVTADIAANDSPVI